MMHERNTAEETMPSRGVEDIQFRLIYCATFVALVAAGCITWLLSWRASNKPSGDGEMSVIRRAKEHAATFSALAMG
jgi:hypothetical protein